MRVIILLISLYSLLFSINLKPIDEIKMSGNVIDMVIKHDILYVATDAGVVDIYDIKRKDIIQKIQIPQVHDFTGELQGAKIYSIDILENKLLILAQGEEGSRELYLHDKKLIKIISSADKLTMKKAKFVDKNLVLLGLLSNELILHDIKKRKHIYKVQLSQSRFSDFALNENKTKVATGCESGKIFITWVKNGKIIKILDGANKDNVYDVDYKKDKVLGAGQDRRGSVYDVNSGSFEVFQSNFLIYAGEFNPSATMVAFSFNEDSDIVIFNLATKSRLYDLKGQKSTLNTIIFYDDNTLFSGSDDKYIMKWSLNK